MLLFYKIIKNKIFLLMLVVLAMIPPNKIKKILTLKLKKFRIKKIIKISKNFLKKMETFLLNIYLKIKLTFWISETIVFYYNFSFLFKLSTKLSIIN